MPAALAIVPLLYAGTPECSKNQKKYFSEKFHQFCYGNVREWFSVTREKLSKVRVVSVVSRARQEKSRN